MKLPATYLSLIPASPSLASPQLCCIIAHSSTGDEVELFEFPEVVGYQTGFYYSNQPEHLEILTDRIAQSRAAEGMSTSRIELTTLSRAATAIRQHLRLPDGDFSPDALRACLNRIPLSFKRVELASEGTEFQFA